MADTDDIWTPPYRPGIEGIIEEQEAFLEYAEIGQVPTTPHPISTKQLKLQREQAERDG